MNLESCAWEFLEKDCPKVTFCGFKNGPGALIEARELPDGRYLIVETPCFMEGLDDVYMGEVVTAVPERENVLRITEIGSPLRMTHYSVNGISRGTPLHELVTRLNGEWESHFNGMICNVHIPLEHVTVFEAQADVDWEKLT
jgi:hypothetical protein